MMCTIELKISQSEQSTAIYRGRLLVGVCGRPFPISSRGFADAIGMRARAGQLAAIHDQILFTHRRPSNQHSRISRVPAAYRACADRDVPDVCGVMPWCGMVRHG